METSVYEVTFKDGRIYRVFCANRTQKDKFKASLVKIGIPYSFKTLTNGIHTSKQWNQIIETLN